MNNLGVRPHRHRVSVAYKTIDHAKNVRLHLVIELLVWLSRVAIKDRESSLIYARRLTRETKHRVRCGIRLNGIHAREDYLRFQGT